MNIYLNAADGRKEKKLLDYSASSIKNAELYTRVMIQLKKLLDLSKNDGLYSSQNLTTNLIWSLLPIFNHENYRIIVSSHEIKWFKTLFDEGHLPTNETTRPNYASQKEVSFIKRKIEIFEPEELTEHIEKLLKTDEPTIIIVSHVSRMTGQLLITEKLYRMIKKINPKNVAVVDGSQAVGAIKVRVKKTSDIYIGVTSKFIGAEPHMSFCWIKNSIIKSYGIKPWKIDTNEYSHEIYSTYESLKKIKDSALNIKELRQYLERSLAAKRIMIWKPKTQINNILLIPIKKKNIPIIINKLSRDGVTISFNTGWSIAEPDMPSLRISISPTTTKKELDYFVGKLVTCLQ